MRIIFMALIFFSTSWAWALNDTYNLEFFLSTNNEILYNPSFTVKAGENVAWRSYESSDEQMYLNVVKVEELQSTPSGAAIVRVHFDMKKRNAQGKEIHLSQANVITVENEPALVAQHTTGGESFLIKLMVNKKPL